MASDSKVWKQLVTDAVIGEIGSIVIGHFSSFFAASSAMIQAIRFGRTSAVVMASTGAGAAGGKFHSSAAVATGSRTIRSPNS